MKTVLAIFLILAFSFFNIPYLLASEGSPTNIGLTRFEAISLVNGIRVEWDTDTELGTVGYMLKKGQSGSFSFIKNSEGSDLFISSEGGPDYGSNYSYTDDKAVIDEIYTYQLVEVAADGSRIIQAESSAKAGLEPTQTPIGLPGTGGDGNDGAPTATFTPRATSQPANTAQPQNTPQPSPTISATNPPPTVTPRLAENGNFAPSPSPIAPQSPPSTTTEFFENTQESTINNGDESANTELGVTVALAQEEDMENSESSYPGSDLDQPANDESLGAADQAEIIGLSNEAIDGNNQQPVIIGNSKIQNDNPEQQSQNQQMESDDIPGEGLLGRLYLWVGFIAALVIFIAAVIGAILLYTRRRFSE